jgi:rhodanese-related sulfurtransferase
MRQAVIFVSVPVCRVSAYLVLVSVLAVPVTALNAHTDITASEAHDMIVAGGDLIILDVREYSEFCGVSSHIEDAVSLPWNSGVLQARSTVLPLDRTIIVVCASGSRSHQASSFLDSSGYTQVHDMGGGMGAWSWEVEGCDAEPVIRLHKPSGEVEINWAPTSGAQDYDLLRGLIENLVDQVSYVDLGITECLADDTPFTYDTDSDSPFPGSPYFYLVRQRNGSWGQSFGRQDRVPGSSDCGSP